MLRRTGHSRGMPNRRQVSVLCGEAPHPQGDRWHLPALPTTLARLVLRTQARRKEKGPHSAPHHTRPYKDYEKGIACSMLL